MERAREFSRAAASLGKDLFFRRLEQLIKSEDVDLNYEIIRAENIDKARKLVGEGKILTAVPGHRAHAEIASGTVMAIKEGFGDLVKGAHIVMSVKYLDHFPTNLLPSYFDVWPVVPHTLPDYPNRDEINRIAIEKAENVEDGSIIVILPEGTRSGQKGLQEARYGAYRFWHGRGERYVMGIGTEGTEMQWPKSLGLFVGGVFYCYIGRLLPSRFIFGEPIPVAQLDEVAQRLAGEDKSQLARWQTDVVMGEIARLHLEYGKPKYAGRYKELGNLLRKRTLPQVS